LLQKLQDSNFIGLRFAIKSLIFILHYRALLIKEVSQAEIVIPLLSALRVAILLKSLVQRNLINSVLFTFSVDFVIR
jgi:hypothetical protein